MLERYSRALRLTAPKMAAATAGLAFEGYWLDDQRFYFTAERFDSLSGRIVGVPSIADWRTQQVTEVLSCEELAALLDVDIDKLADADFDMQDAGRLGVSIEGRGYLIDLSGPRVIDAKACFSIPALYSPDGRYACFVKGHDIEIRERHTGTQRIHTTDGVPNHCYGQHSETAMSAISYRKRPSPVGLWSPDSHWFLTHQIDERSLPEVSLVEHAPPGGGRPMHHRFKYALPGDSLPTGVYVAFHIPSGRRVRFDDCSFPVSAFSPFFLRRVWFGEPGVAWFVRLDRYHQRAELIRLDLIEGTTRIVLSETVDTGYIDLHPILTGTPNVRTLAQTNEVIWYSERDGWGHLYLYDASTGRVKNRITAGEWMVRDVVHVDEAERKLWFLASGIDPDVDRARRVLCSVSLDGSGFEILLAHAGDVFVPKSEPCGLDQYRPYQPSTAQCGVSPDGRLAVVKFSSVDKGNVAQIVELRARSSFTIAAALPASDETSPQHFTLVAADEETALHGVLFVPADFDRDRRYPLIDYIYPGPQISHQPQGFSTVKASLARSLAELGCVVMMLDTRGTPLGSRAFHQVGYGHLLEPQLADHAAAVGQLCKRHAFIDPTRVGMIGSSGGGAATVRALCDYPDVFKVGVAFCGNHDSDLYASIWSDKYRGHGGAEKWVGQANSAVAHRLRGKLLLVSGDMDENVHVAQTFALVDALIRANKDFDLLIVPNAGHGVMTLNGYALRRAWDYFVTHLLHETPPPNFQLSYEPHELRRAEKNWTRESRQT